MILRIKAGVLIAFTSGKLTRPWYNDGKDVYGHFYTGKWGSFDTYFKFHINSEGKIYRLDIGQM